MSSVRSRRHRYRPPQNAPASSAAIVRTKLSENTCTAAYTAVVTR